MHRNWKRNYLFLEITDYYQIAIFIYIWNKKQFAIFISEMQTNRTINLVALNCWFCILWRQEKERQAHLRRKPTFSRVPPMSSTLWRCFWIQSHCFPWLRWTGPFLCGSRLPKHSILLSTWNWGAQSTRWSRGQGNNESEKKKKPNKTKFRGRKFPLIDQSKTDSEVERGRVLDIQLLNDCMKTKAGTDSSFLAPSPPLPSPPRSLFLKKETWFDEFV